MDDLPPHLILHILSQLADSADLARCRVASKTLNSLARELRSVHLRCSRARYTRSRSHLVTPFKAVFLKLVSELRIVESVSIGVERPMGNVAYDADDVEDEEDDDLFLSDVRFAQEWVPRVCGALRSLSISDFWVQSCWRKSGLLQIISTHCHELIELDIKNAWLSVENLNPMPNLTSLTLEFIRLDDENLNALNKSFPSLQGLNLIGVGGLSNPKIHLTHLKTCQCTVSNAPDSITIIAPNLMKLDLKCVKPKLLSVEAPSLSKFRLSLERAGTFKTKEFYDLKTLRLESTDLRNVLHIFPFGETVRDLTINSTKWDIPIGIESSCLEVLLCVFRGITSLTLNAGAWSEFEMFPCLVWSDSRASMKGLKELTAYLTVNDIETTLSAIFVVLKNCAKHLDVALLIHRDVVSSVTSSLILRCKACSSSVRWKWGTWKEGMKDAWISDGI